MIFDIDMCVEKEVWIPVEKHLEKEKGGRRWGLEAEESLSALAVEEAHILSAIRDRVWGCVLVSVFCLCFCYVLCRRDNNMTETQCMEHFIYYLRWMVGSESLILFTFCLMLCYPSTTLLPLFLFQIKSNLTRVVITLFFFLCFF